MASALPVRRPLGTGPVRGRDVSPVPSGLSTEIFGITPEKEAWRTGVVNQICPEKVLYGTGGPEAERGGSLESAQC